MWVEFGWRSASAGMAAGQPLSLGGVATLICPRNLCPAASAAGARVMTRPKPPPGPVPAAVTSDLDRLEAALDAQIPTKTDANLPIGTWNLRAFSGLTPKWQSTATDSPKRDRHALACIAAVVDRFDVTAVQETRRNTTALFALPGYPKTLSCCIRALCQTASDSAGDFSPPRFLEAHTRAPAAL